MTLLKLPSHVLILSFQIIKLSFFLENKKAGSERFSLPETVDLDALDEDEVKADVCYFIMKGNTNNAFVLNTLSHQLTVIKL